MGNGDYKLGHISPASKLKVVGMAVVSNQTKILPLVWVTFHFRSHTDVLSKACRFSTDQKALQII